MKEDDYEQLYRRAKKMRINAKSLINTMQMGAFQSLYYGHGVEFSGVREYLLGDDVRAIDWNVTARIGRPYVKLYLEDRELQFFLIIDRSLSMRTGSGGKSKLDCANETGELISLVAEQSSSPLGAVFFSNEIEFACAPKIGKKHVQFVLTQFENINEKVKAGSILINALTGSVKLLKKRSLVFVISDFRIDGWKDSLAYLALRHDVIAVRINDSLDSELPDTGSIPFMDRESGKHKIFPTSSGLFRRAWRDADTQRRKEWKSACLRCGCMPLEISTSEDPAIVLSNFFTAKLSNEI
ncbi:MAG: DUF58 domain-containing protein [Treponema sp.]|nr:DUF58 domain-containing protein [Treponema sp.]